MDAKNIGDEYQARTKYKRDELPRGGPDFSKKPPHFKVYKSPVKVVDLPEPDMAGGGALWRLLARRRTRRTYKPKPLTLKEISQILWAANGKTKEGWRVDALHSGTFLRSAPSAGALYPVELYVMANDVDGLGKGIYHFDVARSRLSMIREGDYSGDAAQAALGQQMLAKSGAVVFMTAVVERTKWKYGARAYRYIYLDAGHIGQNICLAAESLGLGLCPIGAFYDDELNAILGVDGIEETVLYAMTIGR
jgi:SagB-type dehydrogenase family enzyme